jgi:GNAT superfamily N-acetyltransferase
MAATQEGVNAVLNGLGANIVEKTGIAELGKALRVFLQSADGKVVGGAIAEAFGGWVYVSLLWVEKALRGKEWGTRLMRTVEEEAVKLGCRHAHLDTYSFEARPFYEKLGYKVFATLEHYPPGYSKYFLKKTLAK